MILSIFLQATGGGIASFLPFILIIVVFYFFMIRPQMKKQKEETKYRTAVGKGDQVVTTGGIHGKIIDSDDDTFTLEVDGKTKLRVEKAAISRELSVKYQKKEEDKK
ncbi:MAG: preprotein translocase subunit YajC [Flavobacteriales bacterium]|jgi:preprotein translocase subunit YajC